MSHHRSFSAFLWRRSRQGTGSGHRRVRPHLAHLRRVRDGAAGIRRGLQQPADHQLRQPQCGPAGRGGGQQPVRRRDHPDLGRARRDRSRAAQPHRLGRHLLLRHERQPDRRHRPVGRRHVDAHRLHQLHLPGHHLHRAVHPERRQHRLSLLGPLQPDQRLRHPQHLRRRPGLDVPQHPRHDRREDHLQLHVHHAAQQRHHAPPRQRQLQRRDWTFVQSQQMRMEPIL